MDEYDDEFEKKSKRKPNPLVRRVGRRKTGRNIPFSQMVTLETANLFYDMQRQMDVTMGEVLERAAKSLQKSHSEAIGVALDLQQQEHR